MNESNNESNNDSINEITSNNIITSNNTTIYNVMNDINNININNSINIIHNRGFVHFETTNDCSEFINYINSLNRNIQIGHRCCENKGCEIRNICSDNINILRNEFIEYRNSVNNM
jgi:hypothetical protein